jgi:Fe-S oxidoreductase
MRYSLSVKPFAEGMEVLFFPGCYLCYDPRLKKVARATADILNRAGIDFGILGPKENCCGESIRKTGDEELFKRLARENIKAFIDNGVQKIMVSSPYCITHFEESRLAQDDSDATEIKDITEIIREVI